MLNLGGDEEVMDVPEGMQPPPVTQETQGTQDAGQAQTRTGRLRKMVSRYSPSLGKKSRKDAGGSRGR
jgi:hypothetical protein